MLKKKILSSAKKVFNLNSIKTKIFLLNLFVIVISLCVLAYYSNRVSSKAIIDKAVKNADRELVLINKSLSTLVNDIENYSRILSCDYRLQAQLERKMKFSNDPLLNVDTNSTLSEVMSNIVEPNTNIIASSIMSNKDILFEVGGADISSVYQKMDKDILLHAKETWKPTWTGLFRLKLSNGKEESVFAVVKAIIHKDLGINIGTSILFVSEKDISSVYLNNSANKSDSFFILDEKGSIVSSQRKDDLYKEFDIKSYDMEGLQKGGYTITEIDGEQVLLTVQYFDKLKWKIINTVPLDDITTEKYEINKIIIIVGILCLIFAFVASLAVSNAILNPVKKLVKVMNYIEMGNMDKRADIKSSDELGVLGKGFNRLMDKVKVLLDEVYMEQKKRRQYEYKLLQAQVNPHFLYNAIETIISLITLDMKEGAITTAKNLAGFYRVSLSKGKDVITVEEELKLIRSYLDIQKQRYSEYMDFHIEFQEGILKFKIPKLTIQPVVENSIYHGLKPKGRKGNLFIKGQESDGKVVIEVFDDGVGISDDRISKLLEQGQDNSEKESFGLMSVNARIKLLCGSQYGIEIDSQKGKYTKVLIILPMVE